MIYVPDDTNYNECYVVQSEGVIRGYDTIPRNNTSYNYRDYFINSSYIFKDGVGTWNQYSTLPTCLPTSTITNNFWYRLDLPYILIIVLIINIFGIWLPTKIISKLFKRGVM